MVLVLLTAGLDLRVVTQVAYRPALLYIDSPKYLTAGLGKYDPQGYRLFVLNRCWRRGTWPWSPASSTCSA